MKKIFVLSIALCLLLSFTSCETNEYSNSGGTSSNDYSSKVNMGNDDITITGVYVDNSYTDSNGAPLKMLYVFMAVHPTKNIQIDSNYTTLKIGENSYDSNFYKGACVYMPNYYYSSFIEDVYLGTEAQLAMTFLVAEADLRGSKIVTLRDMSIPFDGISFTTDSFVFCDSIEEIGSYADPVAYEEEREKKQPADYSLENKVRNSINGYYVTFYQTLGTMIVEYELEFAEPNYFELRSDMLSNSGTYDVCKGYIVLNYITGGDPLYIAYDFDSGDIALYCSDAFSVYQ